MKKVIGISLICIFVDQIIKFIVTSNVQLGNSKSILSDFFSITYVQNNGAAFSMFSGNTSLLVLFSILFVGVIFYLVKKEKRISNFYIVFYGLLLGGVIGNLIDRIVNGYVIDYLSFRMFGYLFPIFNIADICIVVACLLYILNIIKEEFYGNH